MPKYKLQLVKYTLPDAIKKYNDKVKLKENNIQKDEISKKLKELDSKYKKDQEWSEEDKAEKNKLLSKLTKVNNAIYEIKAELNNSTVNLNNANIKELNTNISDISSLINNNKQFNSIIGQQISEILTSQLDLNKIFETENFENMLKDIVEKVSKTQNEEVKNKIEEVLKEINNNNNTANENYQAWLSIRDEIKNAIPEDLPNIIKKYGDYIKKINELKATLYNIIFKKDEDKVSENELEDYDFKVVLLSKLYELVEEELLDKYFNFYPTNIESKLHIKPEDLYKSINNIRKWFSDDEYNDVANNFYNKIISNLNHSKILSAEDVKDIDTVDISNAIDLIQSHIKVYRGKDNNNIVNNISDLKSEIQKIIQKKNKKNKSKGLSKDILSQNISEGLDLDEIHQLNIMNNIIQSLNDINETLKGIKDLLNNSKQNITQTTPQSKQSFSENSQKLGRFKVEKYKPNMSITEFKKLFNTQP